MTALPTSAAFTGPDVTEGQFKSSLNDLRNYLSGLLGEEGTTQAALAALGSLSGRHRSVTLPSAMTSSDRGLVITASGVGSYSLPALSSVPEGFGFYFLYVGDTAAILNPFGSEEIDDKTTLSITAGLGGYIYRGSDAWYSIGLLGARVTEDGKDRSEGRFTRVGDHGGGCSSVVKVPTVLLGSDNPTGHYIYSPSDGSGPSIGGGTVVVQRNGSQFIREIAHPTSGTDMYQRHSSNSGLSWSGWLPIYTSGNIVGQVELDNGVPSGAIIEAGRNANGHWIKWADGTMECWREANIDVTETAVQLFDPPVAFVGTRRTIATSFNHLTFTPNPALELRNIQAAGFTSAWMVKLLTAGTPTTPGQFAEILMLRAIGRWS